MNRIGHIVSVLVMGITLIQCDKEPMPRASSLETPLVTGFEFVDEDNNRLGQIGIPNDNVIGVPCTDEAYSAKMGVKDKVSSRMLIVYPNPCKDLVQILLPMPNIKHDIWLVNAVYTGNELIEQFGQEFITNSLGINSVTVGGAPLKYIKEHENNNIKINMREIQPGCYRVYVDVCGNLLWANILKTN